MCFTKPIAHMALIWLQNCLLVSPGFTSGGSLIEDLQWFIASCWSVGTTKQAGRAGRFRLSGVLQYTGRKRLGLSLKQEHKRSWRVLTVANPSPAVGIVLSHSVITLYGSVDGLSMAVVTRCSSLITVGWNCINVCFLFSGHYGRGPRRAGALQFLLMFSW